MTKRALVANCNQLRSHLSAKGYATEEEFDVFWPERKNAPKDVWWECRCQLMRFMGRAEWLYSRSPEAEEQVLATLRDDPVHINLLTGGSVDVYPKCFDALLWFREMDFVLRFLWTHAESLKQGMESGTLEELTVDPFDLLKRTEAEVSRVEYMLTAAACQPGLGIDREAAAVAGAPFIEMESLDIIRIHKTFVDVNAARMGLANTIVPHKASSGEPMSWNVFFSSMSRHMKKDVSTLMRDHSLSSLLTQVHLSAPTGLEG